MLDKPLRCCSRFDTAVPRQNLFQRVVDATSATKLGSEMQLVGVADADTGPLLRAQADILGALGV
jgi:hypothetical protein